MLGSAYPEKDRMIENANQEKIKCLKMHTRENTILENAYYKNAL